MDVETRVILNMLFGWLIGTLLGLLIIATVMFPPIDYGVPHVSAAQRRRNIAAADRNLREMARSEACYQETLLALIAKTDKHPIVLPIPDCKRILPA